MSSLSPVHTIGSQIMEAILLHLPVTRQEARKRAVSMLESGRHSAGERTA